MRKKENEDKKMKGRKEEGNSTDNSALNIFPSHPKRVHPVDNLSLDVFLRRSEREEEEGERVVSEKELVCVAVHLLPSKIVKTKMEILNFHLAQINAVRCKISFHGKLLRRGRKTSH